MSWAQIVMYYNKGIEAKYGKPDDKPKSAKNMSYDDLKAEKEALKKQYGDI